jgi:hypothetical protein
MTMLLPEPSLPLAMMPRLSVFGSQAVKSQLPAATPPQSCALPSIRNVPERYSVARPSYSLTVLFETTAEPSM